MVVVSAVWLELEYLAIEIKGAATAWIRNVLVELEIMDLVTAPLLVLGGPCKRSDAYIERKGCASCGCPCGDYFSTSSNQYECKTCPPPPPPANTGGDDCFPSAARVSLENGKSVMMSELQIGDKVQTGMFTFSTLMTLASDTFSTRCTIHATHRS